VEQFITGNADLFAARVNEGFIRDCDGDIHLENICLADRIYIFDCIEFNSRFRYSDTAADIAFFLMDLDFHRQRALGEVFLEEYILATGDCGITEVLDFYKLYRAVVRGKVESFKLHDPLMSTEEWQSARNKSSRYFSLARGYVLRSRHSPALFMTCGMMGSGKSAIAEELSFALGLEVHRSDLLRKSLAGVSATDHVLVDYNTGIYSPEFSAATYRELLRLAVNALKSGLSVIVDATFARKADRLPFLDSAIALGVNCFVIHTDCPEELVMVRLNERMQVPGEISDGRREIFPEQQAEFEPPANDEGTVIFVDTSQPLSDTIELIFNSLETF
jgi:predicted kinase